MEPPSSRVERVADALANELLNTALSFIARERGCRVRDLDPMLCAALQVEMQRKARLHLPLAVEDDRARNTPMPSGAHEDAAHHDRMTRYHPPGDRYTPVRHIDPDDLQASRLDETQPGWKLPEGVIRSSQRPTSIK